MDYKDKDKSFYEEFETKALSLVSYYSALKQPKNVLKVAKIFLKVRKEKVRLYGSDGANKAKLLQLKAVVKTGGAFVKPFKVEDIMNYQGVLLK